MVKSHCGSAFLLQLLYPSKGENNCFTRIPRENNRYLKKGKGTRMPLWLVIILLLLLVSANFGIYKLWAWLKKGGGYDLY